MASISNPILFSTFFNIDADALADAGLIDPFINVDTPLFIDPVLLEKSRHAVIAKDAIATFRYHFGKFIRLIAMSENTGDAPWRAAEGFLNLSEPPENGLGYGGSGRSGSSRPEEVRDAIMRTAKEIITLGSKDPEMISLMGFFEDNVGPDTISDYTTRVILRELGHLTNEFCVKYELPMQENELLPECPLPVVKDRSGRHRFLVLVPRDIVRDLPMANCWGDIEQALAQTMRARSNANAFLGAIAQATVADRKEAARKAALQSPESFEEFLEAVKAYAATYDPNDDALAYYKMKSIFAHGFDDIKAPAPYDLTNPETIMTLVRDTLILFARHVEHGNLWEELWIGDKPKRERASQLIYYAIADAYCKANNVDISPEAHMGGGPIDFKFSKGYEARVLVEMKRSGGQVRHGYEKQLEFYKAASQTEFAIFVVIDFGDAGNKIAEIEAIRAERLAAGEKASEIIVINATKKASASKRH